MHHELGLQSQGEIAIQFNRLEIATNEEAVAIPVVDAKDPTVLHIFLSFYELSTRYRDGQSLFDDQAVAPRRNQHVAIGLFPGDHTLCINPCLRRCEGVVAEAHSIGFPAIRVIKTFEA